MALRFFTNKRARRYVKSCPCWRTDNDDDDDHDDVDDDNDDDDEDNEDDDDNDEEEDDSWLCFPSPSRGASGRADESACGKAEREVQITRFRQCSKGRKLGSFFGQRSGLCPAFSSTSENKLKATARGGLRALWKRGGGPRR